MSAAPSGEALARACHELRGPLTAIGFAVELGLRAGRLSTAQWRGLAVELARARLALAELEDVPTATRPDLVDVGQLVSDSAAAWRPAAAAVGVELAAGWRGPAARLRADRARLAQATGNLIANAIEHGGRRVEVRGTEWGGGVRIEVADDGPGLPAPVTALVAGARRRGGRGRGLAIAAEVAAGHGGRLDAAEPSACGPCGPGACLVLALPHR